MKPFFTDSDFAWHKKTDNNGTTFYVWENTKELTNLTNAKVQPVLDRVEGLEHDCRHLKGSWLECLKRLKAAEETLKFMLDKTILTKKPPMKRKPFSRECRAAARAYFASHGEPKEELHVCDHPDCIGSKRGDKP